MVDKDGGRLVVDAYAPAKVVASGLQSHSWMTMGKIRVVYGFTLVLALAFASQAVASPRGRKKAQISNPAPHGKPARAPGVRQGRVSRLLSAGKRLFRLGSTGKATSARATPSKTSTLTVRIEVGLKLAVWTKDGASANGMSLSEGEVVILGRRNPRAPINTFKADILEASDPNMRIENPEVERGISRNHLTISPGRHGSLIITNGVADLSGSIKAPANGTEIDTRPTESSTDAKFRSMRPKAKHTVAPGKAVRLRLPGGTIVFVEAVADSEGEISSRSAS